MSSDFYYLLTISEIVENSESHLAAACFSLAKETGAKGARFLNTYCRYCYRNQLATLEGVTSFAVQECTVEAERCELAVFQTKYRTKIEATNVSRTIALLVSHVTCTE